MYVRMLRVQCNMKKIKAIDANQRTLHSMFAASKPSASQVANEPVNSKQEITISSLRSDDPIVQAYYNTLKPNERRAHEIAIEKLGTSYDVVRTHGFLNWQKRCK